MIALPFCDFPRQHSRTPHSGPSPNAGSAVFARQRRSPTVEPGRKTPGEAARGNDMFTVVGHSFLFAKMDLSPVHRSTPLALALLFVSFFFSARSQTRAPISRPAPLSSGPSSPMSRGRSPLQAPIQRSKTAAPASSEKSPRTATGIFQP